MCREKKIFFGCLVAMNHSRYGVWITSAHSSASMNVMLSFASRYFTKLYKFRFQFSFYCYFIILRISCQMKPRWSMSQRSPLRNRNMYTMWVLFKKKKQEMNPLDDFISAYFDRKIFTKWRNVCVSVCAAWPLIGHLRVCEADDH